MLEAMKNHTFIDTILSWLKRMIEVFKKHPVQAELIKMQNDIQKLYKQAQKQGFADGEVRYSLGEYSQHQKDNWANSKSIVVYENEQQLRQFIEDAINKRNLNKKMYFGTVSKRLADSIMRVKDIDLYNYNCTLSASEIRKILEDHGNENIESLRGQRAVVVDDFSKIPYIIENADYIYDAGVGDNNRPAVRFVNEDSKISIVAYVTDKHLDLTVQTMYAGIKKEGNLATGADERASANTPEANNGTITSNNNISQKTNVVNSSISENSQSDTTRYSLDIDNSYSYNNLVSKPDMEITFIDDKKTYEPTRDVRKSLVSTAIKNAIAFGKTNENGNVSVYVNDIGTDVVLSKHSLAHGIDRRLEISAPVILNIGKILKNSIKVNELNPKKQTSSNSYVLIGYAESLDNAYPVRMIVNRYTNEIDSIDVLYSVSTKKETAGTKPGSDSKTTLPTVSTISISDLLQNVKDVGLVTSVLSEDVCNKLGVKRPDSVFKNDLKYSIDVPLEGEVYDTIPPGEKAARKVRVPKKVDGTYTNRFVRTIMEHGDISEFQVELLKDGVWHEAEKFRHKVADDKSAIEYAQNRVKDGLAEEEFRKFADGIIKKPGYMKKKNAYFCMCEILNHLQTA